ncbi:MAG: YggS family pyridoxal phosphate-dependent enzyme [Hyphomicrobiaceae bacterium]|nr:YggS family pyridoxal phosphate-dependent enzyme [Hyphomicrobiaceae bacterium]
MNTTIPNSSQSTARERIGAVKGQIVDAAKRASRNPQDVNLIAVSKTFDPEQIEPVIGAGQTVFGENRVQEAQGKWPDLKTHHGDLELHLIGPLQSNKARDAVRLFDVIHTVDRPKIAKAIAKEMALQDRRPRLFVQVNTGEEEQKGGIAPAELEGFLRSCSKEHGLKIEGLMCIPPVDEEAALHFALLQKLAQRNGLKELSMGMSADFETAIAFGATYVRVGTAIFGPRTAKF